MSRYTTLLKKAQRRTHSGFSALPETLEQRENRRRLEAEDKGNLYLPSQKWLLEQARQQAETKEPNARQGSADTK